MTRVWKLATPLVILVLLGAPGSTLSAGSEETKAAEASAAETKAAEASAAAWLALYDENDFAACWETAAPQFRENVKKSMLVDTLKTLRAALGALKSRRLVDAQLMTDPKDAPPGRYAVLLYTSSFADRSKIQERVSMLKIGPDTWGLDGYHLVR